MNTDANGNWSVEVQVTIKPQPERHIIQFEIPGARALSVTESWASSCCTPTEDVPTVSEWGLIVLTLLAMTGGTVILGRRRTAAA